MNPLEPAEFQRRARALKWLLTDVDGVLTDGRMFYGPDGEALKVFHARDGLGLKMLQRAGLRVGLLSARGGGAVERRARELGLDVLLLKKKDKLAAFRAFLEEHRATAREVAFIGDDLPDLTVLAVCGLAFCPADAALPVRETADVILRLPGGRGAVREAAEKILVARDSLEGIYAHYR